MEHFNVTFRPDGRQVSIHAGATIIEAAGQAGIILNSICGGKGTCRKCLVMIGGDAQQVLACQYHIETDLTVTIPQQSRFFEQKILASGIEVEAIGPPDIFKKYLEIASSDKIFGIAVDIGTTTVVAKLIDMTDGNCLATESALNPQTQFGDDCISRISYAETDEKLAQLQKVIIDCINELTTKLCSAKSIDTNGIYEMCVVGNTTMNHIFLKLPVKQLGQAPYKAFSVEARDIPGGQFPLQINPAGNIHTVENIAGFVGSDITAAAFAANIDSAEEVTLLVDIGTNGEIVLAAKDKLYAASCAAGPALEGARISCGSRAQQGAIEAVVINDGDIDVDVIGSGPPRSICGSGLIDAVAILLNLGIVDKTGRFVRTDSLSEKLPAKILSRIGEQAGQPAFCLFETAGADREKLLLTQKDMRQVQLAKAAIRAGIKLLQKKTGLEDSDIKHVFLAGAFGNYIRKENAIRIGLLPEIPAERIVFIGNAAASGAEILLPGSKARELAKELARKIEYIEIANEQDFTTVYTDSISF